MRVLVIGATGMLGNAVFRYFSKREEFNVYGTIRQESHRKAFPNDLSGSLISNVNVNSIEGIINVVERVRPDVIINCVGVVKQLLDSTHVLSTIPINTLFPHKLAAIAKLANSRVIHMSTDCVFSGGKGAYQECDSPDVSDVYGLSKFLGELHSDNTVTLRTSIIGRELFGARSLIDWFLSQKGAVHGYRRAIFSGLPTVEVARVICDYVLPNKSLRGLYHLSAAPISKYDLLLLVKRAYNKKIDIIPDDVLVIDRSLDSSRFRGATGYAPGDWPELVSLMKDFG